MLSVTQIFPVPSREHDSGESNILTAAHHLVSGVDKERLPRKRSIEPLAVVHSSIK